MLVSAAQQSESAVCIHISPLLDFLPIKVTTEHRGELSVLYTRFSLVTYFIPSSVYIDFTFTSHFHALEKEMATHSTVLAWRIPGTGEPGRLPSMGSHRVEHD